MAFIGFLLAFIIGFIGFVLGQMGAGDVKLMSALGAAVGYRDLIRILLIASIIGIFYIAIIYIIKIVKDKKIKDVFKNIKFFIFNIKIVGSDILKSFSQRDYKYLIPFGTCLFLGVVINILFF